MLLSSVTKITQEHRLETDHLLQKVHNRSRIYQKSEKLYFK